MSVRRLPETTQDVLAELERLVRGLADNEDAVFDEEHFPDAAAQYTAALRSFKDGDPGPAMALFEVLSGRYRLLASNPAILREALEESGRPSDLGNLALEQLVLEDLADQYTECLLILEAPPRIG